MSEVTPRSPIRETFEVQPCLIKPKAVHRSSAIIPNLEAIDVVGEDGKFCLNLLLNVLSIKSCWSWLFRSPPQLASDRDFVPLFKIRHLIFPEDDLWRESVNRVALVQIQSSTRSCALRGKTMNMFMRLAVRTSVFPSREGDTRKTRVRG